MIPLALIWLAAFAIATRQLHDPRLARRAIILCSALVVLALALRVTA